MKLKLPALLCGIMAAAAISVTASAAETHSYSIKSGVYDAPQLVWITADEDIDIYYTTNGSLPSEETTPYVREIPIVVTDSTRIRCATYKDGELTENSALTVKIRTAAPDASVDGGNYSENVRVKLTCPDENAVIRYTTDGSAPTEKSKEYTGTLLIKRDVTLKFAAYSEGFAASRTVTEEYNIGAVYEDEERQKLFELVNSTRAQYGLPALSELPELSEIAQQRSVECSGCFSHWRSNGTKWDSLLAASDLKRDVRAENIAYYYSTAEQALAGWMGSYYHRANILNADAEYIGVGRYNNGYCNYWTLIFIGGE